MEIKKNPEVDLQNKRLLFFEIGFAVSLIVVISAFLYTPREYRIEQVESSEEKDVVVKQSVEKSTEVDVQTEIVLEVSKGAAPTVTKDVEISVTNDTVNGDIQIKVIRKDTGEVVFDELVKKGQATILIKNQTGSGTVQYEVFPGLADESFLHEESFDAEG